MKVNQLAKAAQVTAETVRYYTREKLLTARRDPNNGYQIYDAFALQRLQFITQARALGFSIKEIKNIIDNAEEGLSPCPLVRQLLQTKIAEVEHQIIELQSSLSEMQTALADWQQKPDKQPNEHSVCHLIEGWKSDE